MQKIINESSTPVWETVFTVETAIEVAVVGLLVHTRSPADVFVSVQTQNGVTGNSPVATVKVSLPALERETEDIHEPV